MKTVSFEVAHHLGKLHGEILAALPALRAVDGIAVMTVSGDGETLTLGVPDDFNDALLLPVLAAHDPSPPDPPLTKNDILLLMLEGLEPGDESTEIILLVQQEMLRP